MPKEAMDLPDNNANNSESSDFRAHAKVRLEDLQAEEFIKELAREFAEFNAQSAPQPNLDEGSYELTEGKEAVRVKDLVQQDELFVSKDGTELRKSFLRRMLQFFVEYYEKLIAPGKAEGSYRSYTSRELRKKKLLLEAMIDILKKLLLGSKTRNLLDLIDGQIMELRKALENEQDPEMRKVLQDRLNLLMQLRTQLMNARSVGGLEQFFMLLLGSRLAAVSYTSPGEALGSSINFSVSMGCMFDIGNVNFGGMAKKMGGISADIVPAPMYQLTSQISLSLITAQTAVSSALWAAKLQGVALPEYMAFHSAPNRMDDYVSNALLSVFNRIVRAIVSEVANVFYAVYKNTASFVAGADIQQGRGLAARNLHAHKNAHERAPAHDVAADHQQHHNAVQQDFHQQLHIRLEHNRVREERSERSTEADTFFGVRAGIMTCDATRLTYTYNGTCIEQAIRMQRQSPDTAMERASVTTVVQSQVVSEQLSSSR